MVMIPDPHVENLLPPLLAHIPTAFATKAPPSLLPLLAPILRSRVTLLAGYSDNELSTGFKSPSDSWLSLLSWSTNGAELCQSLAQQESSPHPSGEFEIGEYDFKGVRRFDMETVKARVVLLERRIDILYVWVNAKEDKEDGEGWKIVDVRMIKEFEAVVDEETWYPTVTAAEEGFREEAQQQQQQQHYSVKETNHLLSLSSPVQKSDNQEGQENQEEDDSYWDLYDRSPARTPAASQNQGQLPTEDEYFAQYSTVSPVLDPGLGPSGLPAPSENLPEYPSPPTQLQPPQPQPQPQLPSSYHSSAFTPYTVPISPPHSFSSEPVPVISETPSETAQLTAHSPRATSPGMQSSVSVLENSAAAQLRAEVSVKQHISTTIKSLFRLARVSGIAREEFERVVKTELEILGMVEEEEEGRVSW